MSRPEQPSPIGILPVDKPRGPSSMHVVDHIRRLAGKVKAGHAGTLDPLATGVLVLALGRPATRLVERIMATRKRYTTHVDLDAFTASGDLESEREPVAVDTPPDEESVRRALDTFRGEIMQRPPAHSAMKVGGRRAYRLARRGEAPEMPARPVLVHDIRLVRYAWPVAEIDITCGRGFYVRSLARDLGEILGTGGHCASIRRTAVGPFTIDLAVSLDAVPNPLGQEHVIAVDDAIDLLAQSGETAKRRNGET